MGTNFQLKSILLGLVLLSLLWAGCNGEKPTDPLPASQIVPTFTPTPLPPPGEIPVQNTQEKLAEAPAQPGPTPSPPEPSVPAPIATATETTTPLPTATVTPVSSALLAEGVRLHRIGDYNGARRLFSTLLTQEGSERSLRVEAAFYLAKAYLLDENPLEALAALDRFDVEAQSAELAVDHEFSQDSFFLRGDALAQAGRPADALVAYQQFLTLRPDLAEMVQAEIARTYVAMNNVQNAATAYLAAAEASSDRVRRVLLWQSLATLYVDNGFYAEAIQIFDRILANSVQPGYRTEIIYLAGQALAVAGDEAGAIARWQAATAENPKSRFAYLALIELVNRQVDFDLIQRGIIDLNAQAWAPALTAFQLFLERAAPPDPQIGVALHGMGQAQLGLENPTAAIDLFERVLADYPACACAGQAWLDLARAYATAENGGAARRTYRTFARTQPADPLAGEGLWRSALSAMRDGNEPEMTADFLFLADGFPNHARAPEALYVLSIGAFLRNLPSQAVDTFQRLQQQYPEHRWQAVAYWLGRSHLARGESTAAQAQWQSLLSQEPDGYYGILASQALNRPEQLGRDLLDHAALAAGPASTLIGDDGSQTFAEKWLAGWLQGDPGPYAVLPLALAGDADLRMGRSLLALERRGAAVAVLDQVQPRYQDDAHALFALMLEFEKVGAYRHSLLAARRLAAISPSQLIEDTPIFIQRRIFPRPFIQLISLEAQAQAIDPLVLFSLIRQESLFEEGARSFAAAQGLAQIIPDTATWIAEQLQYPAFYNDLVYRPYINIRFGAYYLAWVREYMDGNTVSALVGYNAGPGNARYWRDLSGPDDTLFVESLTVNEPRIYVQQIVANVYHYNRLYGR